MRSKLAWSLLVAAACLFGATNLAAKVSSVDGGNYTAKDAEFYLTPEQLLFIRPGLVAEIISVSATAGAPVEVTYSITDPAGLPLDNTGITTPGAVDMRFTLAHIPMGAEQKVRLAYERDSRNGMLTALGNGVYKYQFDYVMDSDPDTTHTLVLGFRRDLQEFDLDRYAANDVYDWVPSGMYAPMPRDVVTTDTCNRCHDPLALHGSRWLSPAACNQCHNPTGNTRFDELIHAVHAGTEAGGHDFEGIVYPGPLNACESCHTGGTPTENFPMVATPAAALVCDYSGTGETTLSWEHTGSVEVQVRANANATGKVFARGGKTGSSKTGKWVRDGMIFDLYDLATMELIQSVPVNTTVLGCVSNAPGSQRGVAGAQHTNWLDHPSRVVCGSCHNDIDFAAGEGHIIQNTDGSCYFCHAPTGKEFDLSVKGAHTPLFQSAQLPGVLVKFIEVKNTNAGDKPTVVFSVGGKNGKYNPADMNRLNLVLNGPNDDFSFYVSESVGDAAVPYGSNWAYTFETALPADAMGSYTVSMEGRVDVDVDFGGGVIEGERDYAQNPMMAFAVTDASPMARRMIVDNEKCESCHVSLSLHGGNRTEAQYCTTCHMPDLVDIADVPESVNQKWMIHKIHRGADLENGYVVIRSRGTYDFSHIEYTGDLRNCEKCHVNGSEQLPLPSGLLPQLTPNFWWTEIEPASAACLSCHDGDEAAVHAFVNTSFFGESCSTCHGEGKELSVDKVHAR